MDLENVISNGIEIILQSLALGNKKYEKFKEIGDISGYEIVEKEFLSKYEKLYLGFFDENTLKAFQTNAKEIEKILDDIREKNGFSKDFIEEQKELRRELSGNSGSEVVKNLYEYQIKELKSKKSKLLIEADDILKKEFEINEKLSNAIQQDEQTEIIYELHPLRERFREIDKKLVDLDSKILKLEGKLQKKWYYEIYGTVKKEELLESYKNVFKNGE